MELPGKERNARIVFLDYLRIFAFASVLIGHKFYPELASIANDPGNHASLRWLVSLLLPVVAGGGAGVVVFFLVSGYIITHVLQKEGTVEFLVKRAFRIYPLYMIAVLIQYALLASNGNAPDPLILLSQLLLIGDLFGTPLALNGVEWTLRLEILFYLLMAMLNVAGWIKDRSRILPFALILLTGLCAVLAPLPSGTGFNHGYLTIYGPFLLLGSMIYLYRAGQVGALLAFAMGCWVLLQYFELVALHQPGWIGHHFASIAVGIFLAVLAADRFLSAPMWVLAISELTYAVYLFHNWLFDHFKAIALTTRFADQSSALALAGLFATCIAAVWCVERPAIAIGRSLARRFRPSPTISPPEAPVQSADLSPTSA